MCWARDAPLVGRCKILRSSSQGTLRDETGQGHRRLVWTCATETSYALYPIIRYHTHPRFMPYPAKHVSIRGIEEERYTAVDVSRISQSGGGEPRVLEEVEISRALFEVCNAGRQTHVSHSDKISCRYMKAPWYASCRSCATHPNHTF